MLLTLQQKQNGYTVTSHYKFGSYQFAHDQKWFCFDVVKSVPYVETNCGYLLNALYLTHAIFQSILTYFLWGHKINVSILNTCKEEVNKFPQKDGIQETKGNYCYKCSGTMPWIFPHRSEYMDLTLNLLLVNVNV